MYRIDRCEELSDINGLRPCSGRWDFCKLILLDKDNKKWGEPECQTEGIIPDVGDGGFDSTTFGQRERTLCPVIEFYFSDQSEFQLRWAKQKINHMRWGG